MSDLRGFTKLRAAIWGKVISTYVLMKPNRSVLFGMLPTSHWKRRVLRYL